jgi:hypothetical protein
VLRLVALSHCLRKSLQALTAMHCRERQTLALLKRQRTVRGLAPPKRRVMLARRREGALQSAEIKTAPGTTGLLLGELYVPSVDLLSW